MKKKLTIIGHFSLKKKLCNGQTIRSVILLEEMQKLDLFDIDIIDTHGWKKNAAALIKQTIKACRNSDFIIMMPDKNGVKVFGVLLALMRGKRKTKLIYIIIGGWLAELLKKNKKYIPFLKKFDAIISETTALADGLKELGLNNLHVLPNFKRLDILENFPKRNDDCFNFCFLARVVYEKGVEDAVEAVKMLNDKYGKNNISFDIYGPVDPNYTQRFDDLKKEFPENIRYMGVAEYDKTVEIIKDYFMFLFPTRYYTEGMPGSLIDSFAAGVPVIAYNWMGGKDVISDGIDGFLCDVDVNSLYEKMSFSIDNPEIIYQMKKNCTKKAESFTPEVNIKKLLEIMLS